MKDLSILRIQQKRSKGPTKAFLKISVFLRKSSLVEYINSSSEGLHSTLTFQLLILVLFSAGFLENTRCNRHMVCLKVKTILLKIKSNYIKKTNERVGTIQRMLLYFVCVYFE